MVLIIQKELVLRVENSLLCHFLCLGANHLVIVFESVSSCLKGAYVVIVRLR